MSTEYDITAVKGADINLRFTAKDTTGELLDLTLCTTSGVVRLHYSDTGILLDLRPTIDPSYVSGLINVYVPASGLTDLPITQAVYDIKIYNSGTACWSQVVHGLFNIEPAATF